MTITMLQGDCREILPTLPSDSFDCIVTSPPYYGLRDYGCDGQIGLEPTLNEYLDIIVVICRELRRVLKPSGVFFLNIGDSYARGSAKSGSGLNGGRHIGSHDGKVGRADGPGKRMGGEFKQKDLMMVPNRLAIRLQEDGWYVRSEIIWVKPNPMPESATDRPTNAHEKVWILTKSARYFWDAEAIAETGGCKKLPGRNMTDTRETYGVQNGGNSGLLALRRRLVESQTLDQTRNARNVWTIATTPYSGAHFATMPPALVERCIKAGCLSNGHVLDPFAGAGTTGLVADRLGRSATLIDLNTSYMDMARDRIVSDSPLFVECKL